MTPSTLSMAGELGYLVPYLILAVTGMLLVLAEAFFRGKDRSALMSLGVAGSIASAIASVVLYRQLGDGPALQVNGIQLFSGMLIADRTGYVLSALFAVTTAFAVMT